MSLKSLMDLNGRCALITGGSRGLGLQIAEALGEQGARLMLSARKQAELEQAVAHLRGLGYQADAMVADGSRPEDIARLAAGAIETMGQVDILVNNAGATWGAPAEEHPLEAWDKVMNLNIRSLFLMCQAVGKASMIPRQRGRIVNVASIQGKEGMALSGAYGVSKAGVIALTKILGKELAADGILVNCITPAAAETDMARAITPARRADILARIPLGRFVGVQEIAAMAAFLASDECSFSTGAVFDLSGGRATC